MSDRPTRIIIEEQGLRDGFQSEKTVVPTERKLEIIDALVACDYAVRISGRQSRKGRPSGSGMGSPCASRGKLSVASS